MPAATTTTSTTPKVWLITGCSTGFGREIAIAALNRGDLVIATARKLSALDDLKQLGCEALALDVTADDAAVKTVVDAAAAIHGRIDVLVNNAGVSVLKVIEETSASDLEWMFSTNVFGLLRVTRAVLPFMRAQQSGTIANVGSVAGRAATPVFGAYSASKAAVASVSQALAMEVAAFNIDVVAIEPGMFRTAIAGKLDWTSPPATAGYAPVHRSVMERAGGTVPGDAAKAAKAIVEALTKTGRAMGRQLPTRLVMGGDTPGLVQATIDRDQKELDEWMDYTDASAFAIESEQ